MAQKYRVKLVGSLQQSNNTPID